MLEHVNTDNCCACDEEYQNTQLEDSKQLNVTVRFVASLIFVLILIYMGLDYRMKLHNLALRWAQNSVNSGSSILFDANIWPGWQQ